MSKVIKLRKGLDINLVGAAERVLTKSAAASSYALVPDHYRGVTPKMLVKVGDKVKAGSPLFFVDGAVIVGYSLQPYCRRIVLVRTGDAVACQRICARDGISPEAAQRRLDAQTPLPVLEAAADYIIDNDRDPEALRQRALEVLEQIVREVADEA